jgi:predicted nuclease of predicted toxin-antitoxin system
MLIDMNLSPEWGLVLAQWGLEAIHWTEVGDPTAPDCELMRWAMDYGFVVFTHDLDSGALLAATGATGPSVVQMRCEDARPAFMGDSVVAALRAHEQALGSGAWVTIDPRRMRVTLLPLKMRGQGIPPND